MTDKTQSGELAEKVRECGNCNGSGYDLTGVIAAGGKTVNRVCHVCNGTGTAPSAVGLVEEPFIVGGIRRSYSSLVNYDHSRALISYIDALRTVAEQLRDENLEIKRAHLDEHLRANAAEQRVGELEESERSLQTEVEELVYRQEQWRERAEQLQRDLETKRVECDMLYESAGLMKRDLDSARACINSVPEPIFSPDDSYQWRNWLSKHAAAIALAHREPAGREKV